MSDTPRRRRGRGGQGGHEPRARIRTRELRAMELTVLGWSQQQIAADLGVSQAAVSKILKRVERPHAARAERDIVERQKARQTAAARAPLRRSDARVGGAARPTRPVGVNARPRAGTAGAGATVAELVVENQHGDPRYLDEARKALADHRKLWGLDAPQKVDVRASRNPYDDMTEEALRDELARQTRLLAAGEPVAADPANAC